MWGFKGKNKFFAIADTVGIFDIVDMGTLVNYWVNLGKLFEALINLREPGTTLTLSVIN